MDKRMKKVLALVLTITMVVLGLNGNFNLADAHPPMGFVFWRVEFYSTEIRRTPAAPSLGVINRNAHFTRFPTSGGPIVSGNWTWIEGIVSGTNAQRNGHAEGRYYVATSQIVTTEYNSGTCAVASGSSVRHAPGGANHGTTGGSGITFRPLGDRISAGGWTWRLGTIHGANSGTWNNRLVWIATSQLPNRVGCN